MNQKMLLIGLVCLFIVMVCEADHHTKKRHHQKKHHSARAGKHLTGTHKMNHNQRKTTSYAEKRIVNGRKAGADQFPWQCLIKGVNGENKTYYCGGILIDSDVVLTAGHCAYEAQEIEIFLGGTSVEEEAEQSFYAKAFSIHPEYNHTSQHNDVAMIKLEAPAKTSEHVKYIALPEEGDIVGVGVTVTVSGWGRTGDKDPTSDDLLYTTLKTISNDDCSKHFGSGWIEPWNLCALGDQKQSTCNGDSGGAVVTYADDGTATCVGVNSFVSTLGCNSGEPSIASRVEYFLPWIGRVRRALNY